MEAGVDDGMIRAPWTAEQVAALNRFQKSGFVHEFTCGNDHAGERVLTATRDGWRCPCCDYAQDWAHPFMLAEPVDPFAALRARPGGPRTA